MRAGPDQTRSALWAGQRDIVDDKLGALAALPAVGAQMAGQMQRCATRVDQRLPDGLARRAKRDCLQTSAVASAQNAAHVIGADDIGTHDACVGNSKARLGIADAERAGRGR